MQSGKNTDNVLMVLKSNTDFVIAVLKRKVIYFIITVTAFIILGQTSVTYGFTGSSGLDNPNSMNIESPTRNQTIFFENDRVEAGVPLKVSGAPEGSTYQWTITGADGSFNSFVTTDNTYTPLETDMEKLITVTVKGLEEAQAFIYYSSLPVVYINNTDGYYNVGDVYSSAVMSMQGNEEFYNEDQLYNGDITIKLRGNSTRWRDKKPFNIKLNQKTDLLGMGKEKHWALLANDIDHTLMRNKLLYEFSGAIGMEPYSKSELVVLIFNNEYYGVYQLCELVNIGSNRVDIYDWEETSEKAAEAIVNKSNVNGDLDINQKKVIISYLEDAMCEDLSWISYPYNFSFDVNQDGVQETYTITDYIDLPEATGGVLLEMDFYAFDGHNPSTMITAYSQPIYFKAPEYALTNKVLFDNINRHIQVFEYALHSTDFKYHENNQKYQANNRLGGSSNSGYTESDFLAIEYDGMHYSELFDLDSLIENFMVCELSMNWDSMKNSVFMYKDIDGLFHMGPVWDFDWAWGNINMFNINTWYPDSWHTTEDDFTYEQYYQTVQWNRSLIRDPYFIVKVYEKYKEIRNTLIEDMIKDGGTIDTYAARIKNAAEANDARWSYSYSQYQSVGFEDSVSNMKDFIHTRVKWLDEQFASLETLVASLGYYQPSSELVVSEIDTKTSDDYVQITAEAKSDEIVSITFQVNGTKQYTAAVIDGKAISRIPVTDLLSDEHKLNIVVILAKDSQDNYLIETMEEGNYYNAKSNYAVFYLDKGDVNGTAQEVTSQSDNSDDHLNDVPTGDLDEKKDNLQSNSSDSNTLAVAVTIIIVILMISSTCIYILTKNKKINCIMIKIER